MRPPSTVCVLLMFLMQRPALHLFAVTLICLHVAVHCQTFFALLAPPALSLVCHPLPGILCLTPPPLCRAAQYVRQPSQQVISSLGVQGSSSSYTSRHTGAVSVNYPPPPPHTHTLAPHPHPISISALAPCHDRTSGFLVRPQFCSFLIPCGCAALKGARTQLAANLVRRAHNQGFAIWHTCSPACWRLSRAFDCI